MAGVTNLLSMIKAIAKRNGALTARLKTFNGRFTTGYLLSIIVNSVVVFQDDAAIFSSSP